MLTRWSLPAFALKNRGGSYILQDSTGALFPRNASASQMKKITDDQFATDHAEVDCILNHRGDGASRKYLAKWKGRDVLTWEPVSHFDDFSPWTCLNYRQQSG